MVHSALPQVRIILDMSALGIPETCPSAYFVLHIFSFIIRFIGPLDTTIPYLFA